MNFDPSLSARNIKGLSHVRQALVDIGHEASL